jgi:hypothetical protein
MGKKEKQSKQGREDRFEAAETRPQFRSLKKHHSKVVLDERFSSVLTDSRFQLHEKDKYGKRGKNKKRQEGAKEELSAFYTIEEDQGKQETKEVPEKSKEEHATDSESEQEEDPAETNRFKVKDNDEDGSSEDPNDNEDPASRIAYLTALSRGQLAMSSSSGSEDSSDSSDDDDDDEEEDPVHGSSGVLDPSARVEEEVELSYEESPYLVATNLDWQNLRAVDIFAILSSFAPPGALKRVQVYQSDFGMERMAKEKLSGPTNIWKRTKVKKSNEDDESESDSSEQDQEGSDDNESEAENENNELVIEQEEPLAYDESDFDPEKLRAYEASKLKYYFAVVEFAKPEHADIAYREVDGMEFEHSSSAIDLRTLPPDEIDGVVKDRPKRDEATSLPSNYEPPDFIVSALQKTNVQCTWDQGDVERERKLTKYGSGEWQNMTEADELQAYLASDASSDDESEDEKAAKGSKIRKLLGLDSDDSADQSDSSNENDDSDNEGGKTLKFVPGSKSLEEKIRNKLDSRDSKEEVEELTPWQKYQEKRKQRRRERKQAAKNRASGKDVGSSKTEPKNDEPSSAEESEDEDDFFADTDGKTKKAKHTKPNLDKKSSNSSKHELELLLAGENEEEEARDYDIRGIQRMDKNKDKKLRGSRKRKEEKIAADVSGKDFKVNTQDSRFAAVLEGSDALFGIDKTDPSYKDTSGMREILSEQTQQRKKKRKKKQGNNETPVVAPNVSVEQNAKSSGASALSALVKKLKTQVS